MRLLIPTLILATSLASTPATSQTPTPTAPAPTAPQTTAQGKLLLVLPFENHALQPNLGWISEAVPELFNDRLASAGFLPIGRADRLYALDHLGLPPNFQPSHASMLRLAQTLDADYVIFGTYSTNGNRLRASARILDVKALKLSNPLEAEGDLVRMLDLLNSLAWQIARQLDPAYAVAEQTFVAADAKLPVDAFENYARGLVESSNPERIRHLKEAVRLSPDFDPAWLGLGRAWFANQDYTEAATAFGRLRTNDPRALEADFYRGLALFFTGKYDQAEDAFAFVSTRLPLPEVVNNQAVAASRRGKDSVALYLQAITADPNDADYHFNAAIGFYRRNDLANAQHQLDLELKLRPNDTEAQQFAANLHSGGPKLTSPSTNPAPAAPATAAPSTPAGSAAANSADRSAGSNPAASPGTAANNASASSATRSAPAAAGSPAAAAGSAAQGATAPANASPSAAGAAAQPSPAPNAASGTASAAPAAKPATAAANAPQLPLERIKRGYNEASFRQAASEIEEMQAMRLATMPAPQRAEALTKNGQQFLGQGLMLEAEREFQAALEADPHSADAHAGLAQVRERSSDTEAARREAQQSLALQPNAPAHLVLARLDLKQNQLSSAAGEVSQALKLQPNDPAARGMRQALESRGQQIP